MRDHSRKTVEISEVLQVGENGMVELNPLYQFEEDENSTLEHVSGQLVRTGNEMQNTGKLLLAGIKEKF